MFGFNYRTVGCQAPFLLKDYSQDLVNPSKKETHSVKNKIYQNVKGMILLINPMYKWRQRKKVKIFISSHHVLQYKINSSNIGLKNL